MKHLTKIGNTALTFGEALELVKEGKLMQREGWNGKEMFIFQRPADSLPVGMVIEVVKSLPKAVKAYYAAANTGKEDAEKAHVNFSAYLCMKAADGSIVNGWLASQTDMLASDWVEVVVTE